MADVETIISVIRSRLNVADQVRMTDAALLPVCNVSYQDIAVKALCCERVRSTRTRPGHRYLPLPPGAVVKHVAYDADPPDVYFADTDDFAWGDTDDFEWDGPDAVEHRHGLIRIDPRRIGHVDPRGDFPRYYFQWGDYLVIEPVSPTEYYPIKIYYAGLPGEALAGAADETSDLPAAADPLLYDFGEFWAALRLKRWAAAIAAYNRYIPGVQRLHYTHYAPAADPAAARERAGHVDVKLKG